MPPPPSRIHLYCACLVCYACWRGPTASARSPLQRGSAQKRGVLDVAMLRRAGVPLGVGIMRAAEPLAAPLAILLSAFVAGFIHARNSLTGLFLRLYGGYSRH